MILSIKFYAFWKRMCIKYLQFDIEKKLSKRHLSLKEFKKPFGLKKKTEFMDLAPFCLILELFQFLFWHI